MTTHEIAPVRRSPADVHAWLDDKNRIRSIRSRGVNDCRTGSIYTPYRLTCASLIYTVHLYVHCVCVCFFLSQPSVCARFKNKDEKKLLVRSEEDPRTWSRKLTDHRRIKCRRIRLIATARCRLLVDTVVVHVNDSPESQLDAI